MFADLPAICPGSRLVVLITLDFDDIAQISADWLVAWAERGLTPELSHACDPVPGDVRFGRGWIATAAIAQLDGYGIVGCVLARRLTLSDLASHRVWVTATPVAASTYFPLSEGERIPVPVDSGRWALDDLAAAYGLADADLTELADELLWSGALTLG